MAKITFVCGIYDGHKIELPGYPPEEIEIRCMRGDADRIPQPIVHRYICLHEESEMTQRKEEWEFQLIDSIHPVTKVRANVHWGDMLKNAPEQRA